MAALKARIAQSCLCRRRVFVKQLRKENLTFLLICPSSKKTPTTTNKSLSSTQLVRLLRCVALKSSEVYGCVKEARACSFYPTIYAIKNRFHLNQPEDYRFPYYCMGFFCSLRDRIYKRTKRVSR